MDGNRLLNTSVEDLSRYVAQKYLIEVPTIDEEGSHADQREAQIDVSQEFSRDIRDRSRPHYVTGTAIDFTMPFNGDAGMFKVRPNTYGSMPPRAAIDGQNIIVTVQGQNLSADQVRQSIDRTTGDIKKYLEWQQQDCCGFNSSIGETARALIEHRRTKLLNDQNLVAALGFPLKKRADAPTTYIAPGVRRRLSPKMIPQASTAPYKPEPVLSLEDYNHIISVINNMAHVMERSPSAFGSIGEEDLRTHFLVQLNGQYEGQATGETFNYEGKTDILVRTNGRNIFIGECKYWGGPKKLTETIDQLLSYSSWRDTKVAVIIFNRLKSFSRVLEAIPLAMKEHPKCKRELDRRSETEFRYIFSHRDDPNREMVLTVLAFDVPQKESTSDV